MQCFQKDPNLRVTARKLLRHAWIVGCRRADAPVSKAPANFSQAVEEVKQWNKAINSDSTLRASIGSDNAGPSSRFTGGTPAKGPLTLAKPRPGAAAFKSPELAGMFNPQGQRRGPQALSTMPARLRPVPQKRVSSRIKLTLTADDDNWDDDFATAISPSALRLPQLKPQDNFGGLLSSDKLKAFASANDSRSESSNYDDDFEGELMTIKGPSHHHHHHQHQHHNDIDSQEQTIRPIHRRNESASEPHKGHRRGKSSNSKLAIAGGPSRSKSPTKALSTNKFELPQRPDLAFREQSVEDYSDLFADDDNLFDHRVNQAVKKVSIFFNVLAWRILT